MTIARTTCRVCEGALDLVMTLGKLYVSNFVDPDEPDGLNAPLDLMLCSRCSLVQLGHTVPGDTLYRNYWYRSGTNKTMSDALADIANTAEVLIGLRSRDAVLDIGCNDGTLLRSYKTEDIFRIGFDPAENLAEYSRQVADVVIMNFFDFENFVAIPGLCDHKPKIVTSIAMFYDLEHPNQFVADVKRVMDPQGVWIVQMSYLPLMLRHNEVGNICHEHLEYYSLQSCEYLLSLHGMDIVDVELNDVNGGSFRAYIRNQGAEPSLFGDAAYRSLAAERVRQLRQSEASLGLSEPVPYVEFAMRAERIKRDVVEFIEEKARRGKGIYLYGASTKGNTVLQYYRLDHRVVTAAAERNPDKWGKVTVGTRIPIVSEQEARAAKPDYFLVLPWHFIEEFAAREKSYLMNGGRFILPAPHFTLI